MEINTLVTFRYQRVAPISICNLIFPPPPATTFNLHPRVMDVRPLNSATNGSSDSKKNTQTGRRLFGSRNVSQSHNRQFVTRISLHGVIISNAKQTKPSSLKRCLSGRSLDNLRQAQTSESKTLFHVEPVVVLINLSQRSLQSSQENYFISF